MQQPGVKKVKERLVTEMASLYREEFWVEGRFCQPHPVTGRDCEGCWENLATRFSAICPFTLALLCVLGGKTSSD